MSSKTNNLESGKSKHRNQAVISRIQAACKRDKYDAKDFAARMDRIRSISRLTTTRLLALAGSMSWKAILESEVNLPAFQENPERTSDVAEARRVLLMRVLNTMRLRGAPLQKCQFCRVFARLTFRDVEGCPFAGLSSCLDKRRGVWSSKGVR